MKSRAKTIAPFLSFLLALGLATSASAQDRDDPTPLLRSEADVHVDTPGLHRIPLSADVLSGAAAGLSDVRILDAAGDEVPWLLAGAVAPRPGTEAIPLTPVEATRDRRRRVYDRYGRYETFVLDLPAAPVGIAGWDLEIETPEGTFSRRYRVYALEAGSRGRELGRGTLFRFAAPLREKRRIALGAEATRVVVAIDGDDYTWLSPTFSAVAARPSAEVPSLAMPLNVVSRRSEGGITTLRVARPRGVIPSAVRVETSSTTFHRRLEILDVGFGSAERRVGGTTAYRIAEPVGAEHLEVPLSPTRGDTLEIRITDQDAPPLDDVAIVAIVRQPVLVADLPGPVALRFGGGRLRAPRYDLSALRSGELGRRLVEADLPLASVSATRPNPAFDAAPALAWAMRAGAPVDLYRYRYARAVFLDPSEEGLSRIRLSAADLAVLTESLSDLRIADLEGRQWPFVAEADAGIEEVRLVAEAESARGGSAYAVRFEAGPTPIRHLVVRSAAPFVDRDYVLYGGVGDGPERVLAQGRLSRRPDVHDSRDPHGGLRIATGDARVDHLRLVVLDGADAPLESVGLVAEVPVADVYVAAPAGDYQLLLGADGVAAPRYEIQRARDLILSVSPADAHPRLLLTNPAFVPPRTPLHVQDWILWAVLLLSVLVLSLLTIRALRTEPVPEDGGEEEGSEEAPTPTDVPPPEPRSA